MPAILDIKKIYLLETGKFMYKSKNDLLPVTIGKYFETRSQTRVSHRYNLRSRERIDDQIYPRLLSSHNSIQYEGNISWNNLPEKIKNSDSFQIFKKRLKLHLLDVDS